VDAASSPRAIGGRWAASAAAWLMLRPVLNLAAGGASVRTKNPPSGEARREELGVNQRRGNEGCPSAAFGRVRPFANARKRNRNGPPVDRV
jgi:hypothetical protein